jgi:hypothetical protein
MRRAESACCALPPLRRLCAPLVAGHTLPSASLLRALPGALYQP